MAKDYPLNLAKRLKARPLHLENTLKAKADGLILLGGATFSKQNEMDGSMIIFEAESQDIVESFLGSDPYHTMGVWEKFTITPIKLAAVSPHLKAK